MSHAASTVVSPRSPAAQTASPASASADTPARPSGQLVHRPRVLEAVSSVSAREERPRLRVVSGAPRPNRMIDPSLARGIRRDYFRSLAREWRAFEQRTNCDAARNVRAMPPEGFRSDKALRNGGRVLERRLGRLLPAAGISLDARSRSARVAFTLRPVSEETDVGRPEALDVTAFVMPRPGTLLVHSDGVRFTAHAVDRIVQRAGLVSTPVANEDIAAIHAVFADALPWSCVAEHALLSMQRDGETGIDRLNVLLPTQHGAFLGAWKTEAQRLVLKTFVGNDRLWPSEREGLAELRRFREEEIAAHVLDGIAPGWLPLNNRSLCRGLVDCWRRFGWRLADEEKNPAMSDAAWESR